MKTKYLKNLAGVLALATLAACSGSGSCLPSGGGNSGDLTLKLTAPNQYPAGMSSPITAYLTMTNTSAVNASNLYYAIPDASNYTKVAITVQNGNGNPCLNVPAKTSCTFPVVIGANANPGSFTVTATLNDSSSQSSFGNLLAKVEHKLGLQAATLSLTANIGLTDLPTNTNGGANGISFLYSNTIAANESGYTLVSVVGVVNSASAGSFNTINLTDQSGNLLDFTAPSGNSGSGATNLAQGSIVTFLLKIPSSAAGSTFNFYAQTTENGVLVDQGTSANSITVGAATSGVLVVQPTNFNLTAPAYESQIITFTNIGNASITDLTIPIPASPLYQISTNCGSTLAAGASCTYIVGSHADPGFSGDSVVTTSYNNGSTTNSVTTQVHYAGLTPVAGISVTSGDNPTLNFISNTESNSKSSQLTLSNSGNVSESNFVFTVPKHFTLSVGTSGTPCTLSGTTVTSVLAKNTSCTLSLTYSNAAVTNQAIANLLVDYKYHGIDAPQSSISLTYQTTLASAVLQVNPSSYTFGNIRANGSMSESKVFVYTNIGTGTANGISVNNLLQGASALNVVPSQPSATNDCGSNITSLAPGGQCQVTVQFGPTSLTPQTFSKQLQVSYESVPAITALTVLATVNGTILPPLSANMVISNVGWSPVQLGGNGTEATPFAFESSNDMLTVTLTYKNDNGIYAASDFSVDTSALPQGFTLNNNGCNSVPLAINATCNVELNYTPSSAISSSIKLDSVLQASWTDDRGNVGPMTIQWDNGGTMQSQIFYRIFAAPQVTAVMSSATGGANPITSVNAESDFYVVYTLTGGYNIGNLTYGVDLSNAQGGTPKMSVYAPTSCTLSGAQPICYMKLNAGGAAINQNINYTTTGTVATSPSNSGNFDVIGKYAYITNNDSNNYTQCVVTGDGIIESASCTNITPSGNGALNIPTGIAFLGNYAYINDAGSDSYTQCSVGSLGIESANCNTITPTGAGTLNAPGGITFYGNYGYIANVNGNSYTQCAVDNSGVLQPSSCNTVTPSGGGTLNMPRSIGFSGTYAYIVNGGDSSYTQCNVTASGIDSGSCSKVTPIRSGALHGSYEIAFNGSYAYFTNGFSNLPEDSYTQCSVTNGLIDSSSCNTVTPVSPGALMIPVGIVFSGSYAYIVNHANDAGYPPIGGNYTQCSVNNLGIDAASCNTISLPTGVLNLPGGIAIH